ncbi:MAG: hypothetical protein K8R18_17000 [Parvibaculum sp.]|uniref:hypothetical protein n=1 Tax=Parvibaculum sp. TaxID=2024848 RepID=UPI0025D296EE|nr:hypothetical protein [Parvibaculum sp.]MCE9651321.1 hypothetical protein [Parvibaculum sp.]
MRRLKISFGAVLLLVSIAITAACYLQSHGAGIGTGALLFIVITAYIHDHWGHLLGKPATSSVGNLSAGTKVAMRQGRLTAMKQDGDIVAH